MSRRLVTLALVALAAVGAGVAIGFTTGDERAAAAAVAVGIIAAGAAGIAWVQGNVAPEADQEERHLKGPSTSRRRLLLGVGAGTIATTAVAFSVPAARRVEVATRRLRATAWTAGAPIVDAGGELVRIADIAVGDMLTVYPQGHLGAADSQAVLVREDESRYAEAFLDGGWVVDGIVVLSKLCTHMACPLGLYQQQTGTLLCPCHQATFDVLGGGDPVRGPATRRLPRLPIAPVDGGLVALGDFDDAVGTGFWWRP